MRLIDTWTFDLQEFDEDVIPEYAILSHTWEDGEVSYADMQHRDSAREKKGFTKIARAADLAVGDDLRWVWVDTCCIDKSSSAELQEAINSMWKWYSNASVCYVFMSDLPRNMPYLTDKGAFRYPSTQRPLSVKPSDYPAMYEKLTGARWFTRGWCLQELIAPQKLLFYSLRPNGGKCKLIGDRQQLLDTISKATNIDTAVLEHKVPLSSMSVAQRMSWASHRKTRRVEDEAYSLLGIFDVSMPMLYGEGKRAFIRLQEEIMRTNSDHSIFAWGCNQERSDGSLLATSPADFADASRIVQWGHPQPFEMTNRGLRISLPILPDGHARQPEDWGILNCRYSDSIEHTIALRLGRLSRGNEWHVVVSDFSRCVLEGGSVMSPRLGLVHAKDARSASPADILIARKFERDSGNVRIKLHIDPTGADRTHDYVSEIFTEQDVATPIAPVFLTTQKPVARAGVMLQYPSGRKFSLAFGFDRYPPNDPKGVLLPGIWAKFHRGPQKLKEVIRLEPIHSHGRDHTCENPRESGCPVMPKAARVCLLPEGDVLSASISHDHIFDEDVFVVRATITQLHELEAPLGSPVVGGANCAEDVCDNDPSTAVAANSPRPGSPVASILPGRMQTYSEGLLDPFVPDVRSNIFADTNFTLKASDTGEIDLASQGLPTLEAWASLPKGVYLEGATQLPYQGPFHPEIQRSPSRFSTPVPASLPPSLIEAHGEVFDSFEAVTAFGLGAQVGADVSSILAPHDNGTVDFLGSGSRRHEELSETSADQASKSKD